MAVLSTAKRKSLPKSDFGEPGKRAYPMPDKSHAANAKARATQQVKAGNLSSSTKAKIDAKANRVLGESGNSSGDEVRHVVHHHFHHMMPPGAKPKTGGY